MAPAGRGWSPGGPHLLATRPIHRGNGPTSRPYDRLARYRRVPKGGSTCVQPAVRRNFELEAVCPNSRTIPFDVLQGCGMGQSGAGGRYFRTVRLLGKDFLYPYTMSQRLAYLRRQAPDID